MSKPIQPAGGDIRLYPPDLLLLEKASSHNSMAIIGAENQAIQVGAQLSVEKYLQNLVKFIVVPGPLELHNLALPLPANNRRNFC